MASSDTFDVEPLTVEELQLVSLFRRVPDTVKTSLLAMLMAVVESVTPAACWLFGWWCLNL